MIYGMSVGGMIFCLIRQPLFYSSVAFINPSGRTQYVSEGIVIALLCIAGSVSIIALSTTKSYKKSNILKCGSDHSTVREKITYRLHAMARWLWAAGWLVIFILVLRQLFLLYTFKTEFYTLEKVIPKNLRKWIKGPLKFTKSPKYWMRTIVRRGLKIGHAWLFEYNNWKTFQMTVVKMFKK